MGCVGEKNYKYFLLFLYTNLNLALYSCLLSLYIIYQENKLTPFFRAVYRNPKTGEKLPASLSNVLKYLLYYFKGPCFFIIFTSIMGFALCIFFSYHMYLIGIGKSTNEHSKIRIWIPYLRRKIKELQEKNSEKEKKEIKYLEESIE